MMKHIDLCSGIGGFALGFEWAGLSRPAMFCDIEPWSRKVLAKHWPDVPIEEDVKVLANEPEKIPAGGRNTILTAGYPCQPWSQAGRRRGTSDDRHIWPYIRKIVAQKRPSWCVFENVYGHVSLGLDEVLLDLEADGYATRGFIVPACSVDAPHKRDRIWIIARDISNAEGSGSQGFDTAGRNGEGGGKGVQPEFAGICGGEPILGDPEHNGSPSAAVAGSAGKAEERGAEGQGKARQSARTGRPGDDADVDVADTDNAGREEQRQREPAETQHQAAECAGTWKPEPNVGRVAYGIPGRVDRLKGLGNAIVPQIAMQIGIVIRQCEASATGQFKSEKE